MYKCTRDMLNITGAVALDAQGCMHEGDRHALGDTFEDESFWYSCTLLRDDSAAKQLMGCFHDGKRMGEKERYVRDDVILECRVGLVVYLWS